jgi:hypothetical protein
VVRESGCPTAPVARDVGITPNLLRRWKQAGAGDPVESFPGKELARLKQELVSVTQERDCLTSVAAYFAQPSPGDIRPFVIMRGGSDNADVLSPSLSPSGYYAGGRSFGESSDSDESATGRRIRVIHAASRQTYGSPQF